MARKRKKPHKNKTTPAAAVTQLPQPSNEVRAQQAETLKNKSLEELQVELLENAYHDTVLLHYIQLLIPEQEPLLIEKLTVVLKYFHNINFEQENGITLLRLAFVAVPTSEFLNVLINFSKKNKKPLQFGLIDQTLDNIKILFQDMLTLIALAHGNGIVDGSSSVDIVEIIYERVDKFLSFCMKQAKSKDPKIAAISRKQFFNMSAAFIDMANSILDSNKKDINRLVADMKADTRFPECLDLILSLINNFAFEVTPLFVVNQNINSAYAHLQNAYEKINKMIEIHDDLASNEGAELLSLAGELSEEHIVVSTTSYSSDLRGFTAGQEAFISILQDQLRDLSSQLKAARKENSEKNQSEIILEKNLALTKKIANQRSKKLKASQKNSARFMKESRAELDTKNHLLQQQKQVTQGLQAEIAEMKATLSQLQTENEVLSHRHQAHQRKPTRAENKIHTLTKKIATSEAAVKKFRSAITGLKNTLLVQKTNHEEQSQKAKQRLSETQSQLGQLHSEKQRLIATCQGLQQQLHNKTIEHSTTIIALVRENQSLKQSAILEITQRDQALVQLQQQFHTLTQENEKLKLSATSSTDKDSTHTPLRFFGTSSKARSNPNSSALRLCQQIYDVQHHFHSNLELLSHGFSKFKTTKDELMSSLKLNDTYKNMLNCLYHLTGEKFYAAQGKYDKASKQFSRAKKAFEHLPSVEVIALQGQELFDLYNFCNAFIQKPETIDAASAATMRPMS